MQRKQVVRSILTILLTIVFGLSSTACSFGKKTATTTTASKVRIWRYDQDVDPIKSNIDDFSKANKGTTVSFTSHDLSTYEIDAYKSISAKGGPDVWSIPNDWIADNEDKLATFSDKLFINKDKKAIPAAEYIRSNFPDGIADQVIRADGKVIGVPSNADTLILYYNKSLFDASFSEYKKSLPENTKETDYADIKKLLNHPPTTWNELLEQEKYITKVEGNSITRSAIALGTADNIDNSTDILTLLMIQNGATIISTDRKNVMFADQQTTPSNLVVRPGERALDFYASFSNPGKENYTWNNNMPSALDAFAKGKVAMVVAYSDFGTKLKAKYPKSGYATAAIPQVSSDQSANLVRFSVETVTAAANNSSLAFSFLKSYTTETGLGRLASESKIYLNPMKTALEKKSEDFRAKQILTGKTIYKKNRVNFDATFRKMITDVTQNEITAEEAVKAGQDTLTNIYAPAVKDPTLYEKTS